MAIIQKKRMKSKTIRIYLIFYVVSFIFARLTPLMAIEATARTAKNFDFDWKLFKGQTRDAQKPEYNDAIFQQIDVPHDWSIAGPFRKEKSSGRAGGFLPLGVGCYRKTFNLEPQQINQNINFEKLLRL